MATEIKQVRRLLCLKCGRLRWSFLDSPMCEYGCGKMFLVDVAPGTQCDHCGKPGPIGADGICHECKDRPCPTCGSCTTAGGECSVCRSVVAANAKSPTCAAPGCDAKASAPGYYCSVSCMGHDWDAKSTADPLASRPCACGKCRVSPLGECPYCGDHGRNPTPCASRCQCGVVLSNTQSRAAGLCVNCRKDANPPGVHDGAGVEFASLEDQLSKRRVKAVETACNGITDDASVYGPDKIETPVPNLGDKPTEIKADPPHSSGHIIATEPIPIPAKGRVVDGIKIPTGGEIYVSLHDGEDKTISIEPGRKYKADYKFAWECLCGHEWRGDKNSKCPKCCGEWAMTRLSPEPICIAALDPASDPWQRAAAAIRPRSILSGEIPTRTKVKLTGGMTAHGMRNL